MNTSELINLSSSFNTWLKNKNENDYWLAQNIPFDSAIQRFNNYTKQLKQKSLKCKQVTWFVTNKCNLSCVHCGVSANDRLFKELSLEEFSNITPKLKKIGVKYVTLSGGESLLRKDIVEIISFLKDNEFNVGLVTNASLLTKTLIRLQDKIPDSISISIDGLEQNHSIIRQNKSNYSQAIKAITKAKELGVPIVSVATCVYPNNLKELDELKKVLFNAGIDQWLLRPITPSGRAYEKKDYFLDKYQIKDLLIYIKNNIEQGYDITVGQDLGYLGKLDSYIYLYPYFCTIGWDSFVILPNGDIKGFEEDYLPLEGNILKDDIEEIWQNKFKYYRKPKLTDKCLKCAYFPSCRGGYIPGVKVNKRCIKGTLELLENETM
jgi:radical SAM protein with 4Fe4S-binding SPASM domain